MASSEACPKCGGRMEQGFVLDNTCGARVVSQWAPGAPLTSFGTGAFRCSSCGFLELYAREEFAAKYK